MFYRDFLEISTKPGLPLDITDHVANIVANCQIKDGICHLFITATTAGIAINENDRMLYEDFRRLMDELAGAERIYHHPKNGHSHLRASLFGQSISVPVSDGKLLLGQWQRILLWEFDTTPRERKIVLSISF